MKLKDEMKIALHLRQTRPDGKNRNAIFKAAALGVLIHDR